MVQSGESPYRMALSARARLQIHILIHTCVEILTAPKYLQLNLQIARAITAGFFSDRKTRYDSIEDTVGF
jgi:hypothetical protein